MNSAIPSDAVRRLKEDVAAAVLHAQRGEPMLGYRLLDLALSLAEEGAEPWSPELSECYRHALVAFSMAFRVQYTLPHLASR